MNIFLSLMVGTPLNSGTIVNFDEYATLSSPVTVGNQVVVVANSTKGGKQFISSIKSDGSTRWKLDLDRVLEKRVGIQKIVGAGNTGIYFLAVTSEDEPTCVIGRVDTSGNLLWSKAESGSPALIASTSPDGDLVSAFGSDKIARFRPNGDLIWVRPIGRATLRAILADGNATYVAANKQADSTNGLEVKKYDSYGVLTWNRNAGFKATTVSEPSRDGLWLYQTPLVDTLLCCLDMRSGEVKWTRQLLGTDVTVTSGALNAKGDALTTFADKNGKTSVWLLNAQGIPVWKKEFDGFASIQSLHLNPDRSGSFFGRYQSQTGQLGWIKKSGEIALSEMAPFQIQDAGGIVRRSGHYELHGLSELVPKENGGIQAAARSWHFRGR